MEQTAQIKECAHTVAGIVAHVDAGIGIPRGSP